MTTLEVALLWALCLVGGMLGGAAVEVWRLRIELAEVNRRLGALQATRDLDAQDRRG